MNIGWAVKQLNLGKKLRRESWSGETYFIVLKISFDTSDMTENYIYADYPFTRGYRDLGYRIPWTPTQADILAEDWEVFKFGKELNDKASV